MFYSILKDGLGHFTFPECFYLHWIYVYARNLFSNPMNSEMKFVKVPNIFHWIHMYIHKGTTNKTYFIPYEYLEH